MVHDHSSGRDRAKKRLIVDRPPFLSQRRKLREENFADTDYWYCCPPIDVDFPGVVAHIRSEIHGSGTDKIPPWVFTVHQWTWGVALVKDNIAATAVAAPGSDGIATAHPRRKTSGARTPTERPVIWVAIMGEFGYFNDY